MVLSPCMDVLGGQRWKEPPSYLCLAPACVLDDSAHTEKCKICERLAMLVVSAPQKGVKKQNRSLTSLLHWPEELVGYREWTSSMVPQQPQPSCTLWSSRWHYAFPKLMPCLQGCVSNTSDHQAAEDINLGGFADTNEERETIQGDLER